MDKHLLPSHRSPVRKAFSDAAHRYDEHTEIQAFIAAQLLARIPQGESFKRILDIGMGTGRMTQKLSRNFPGTQVVGIDFAEGMVRHSRHRSRYYHTVQADAVHLPFKPSQFDLVISNLTYQWINDLERAFREGHDALNSRGFFLANLFGRHSLYELFECLSYGGAKNFFPQRLPDVSAVEAALRKSRLRVKEVRSQMMTFDFHGMWDLLVWIKMIGAVLPRRGFLGKRILMKANQYYYEHFKTPTGVAATFEVIWVEAERI